MLGHKDILKMGNPILRKIAQPFTEDEIKSNETKILVERMWKIMEEAGGIGLAAPQIAISKIRESLVPLNGLKLLFKKIDSISLCCIVLILS